MKKAELIDQIAQKTGSSKAQAASTLEAVLESIIAGVKSDGQVQLMGFGTFKVSERAARDGRNPRTGETIRIAASKSVRFSPSAAVKKSLK